MTKQWIYKGECRNPKSEEHFIDIDHHPKLERFAQGVVRQVPPDCIQHGAPYPIVHPIPDDVVMVPRERIEALRDVRKNPPYAAAGIRFALPTPYHPIVDAILACAEPAKPKDEILDSLFLVRSLLPRDTVGWRTADRAIAQREKELKERGNEEE